MLTSVVFLMSCVVVACRSNINVHVLFVGWLSTRVFRRNFATETIRVLRFRVVISSLCWFDCRPAQCKYACIGCEWTGTALSLAAHESTCTFPDKSGHELFGSVLLREETKIKEVRVYKHLLDLLSYENVEFVGMYERSCFS